MDPTALRTIGQITCSALVTLGIFALPVWTVTRPVPTPPIFDVAPPTPERIVVWQATIPAESMEPAPTEVSHTVPDAVPDPEPVAAAESSPPSPATEAPPLEEATPIELASHRAEPSRPAALASPDRAQEPTPAPEPSTAQSRKRKRRDCRPDVPEIEETGRDRWAVKRELIDHYASDLSAAARLAHVSWARDDRDKIIGFRVNRIRCGSPLHDAGFHSGDVITRINGRKVRTVPQAIAAYVALRIKRKLHVHGFRKDGAALDLRYRLT